MIFYEGNLTARPDELQIITTVNNGPPVTTTFLNQKTGFIMFQDSIECYQAIGNALANAAKTPWDRIAVEATLDGVRVDVVAACWRESEPSPVAYLTGVPRLASYFYDLARLVSTEEKGLFKKCRFTLEKSGKYDMNFDY